ncbi:hypothetical protein [Herbaspirillum sp.]|uniref:hypothetical protein n=1 Tax=Herbaspirillum sp. TaxID=1890675 RepID=UPI00258AD118|nr:hypothetical protein [Herbaspirillum sp.]
MKEELDVPTFALPESEDSLYQRLKAKDEEIADLKARLRAKDRALRDSMGDPSRSEIVSRSEVMVMLGDHVRKAELSAELADYFSKGDFQALGVSKPEFSQLLRVLYDEVPGIGPKMRALQDHARAKKRSDNL